MLIYLYSILRKVHRCGPVSMFQHLISKWSHLTLDSIADKVPSIHDDCVCVNFIGETFL